MTVYRVHATPLGIGDSVPPSASFFAALSADKARVERFLDEHRPASHLPRSEAVFLFEDLMFARTWASKQKRRLYSVEVEQNHVLHRGDWCWLQLIQNALENNESGVAKLARGYWAGESASENSVWELLARTANIVSEIEISPVDRLYLAAKARGLFIHLEGSPPNAS